MPQPNTDKDPRFSLTDWERESVLRLKEACDKEGLKYGSVFDLAKYVLVSKSVAKDTDKRADEKRLNEALKRLRNYRDIVTKMDLDKIDPKSVLEKLNQKSPGFLIFDYRRDNEGRRVLARCYQHSPTYLLKGTDQEIAEFLAMRFWALDLSAADMVEARRGVAVVLRSSETEKTTVSKAVDHGRLMVKLKRIHDVETHHVRLGKLYVQVPPVVEHLVAIGKKLVLPKKLASRLQLVSTVKELETYVEQDPVSLQDWVSEREATYKETVDKLRLK